MTEIYFSKISIRELVEFVLRSGDLRHIQVRKNRLTDAIEAHTLLQEQSPEGYEAEVSLKYIVTHNNLHLQIQGRADGIYTNDDIVMVDEIKTTYLPLNELQHDHNLQHWAQAKIYAFIYAHDYQLESIQVRLTYYHMETKDVRYFIETCSFEELQKFLQTITTHYFFWLQKKTDWLQKRNTSITNLPFPFKSRRKGQQQLIDAVTTAIDEQVKLFAKAPTGIGKTIATLFAAIRKIPDKIFYLTAKNTGHEIPLQSLNKMRECGLKIKSVVITAKDKICFCDTKDINNCDFTTGYFDRVNAAIKEALEEDNWEANTVRKYAQKYRLCPYEFSLELSLWSDCIICDYNYAFDPRVYLRRFFQDSKGDYLFLIDEAHNLVERARTMFSACIEKKQVLEVRRSIKVTYPKIAKKISKLNTFLLNMRKANETTITLEVLEDFLEILQDTCEVIDGYFATDINLPTSLVDFYFSLLMFYRVATEFLDENYASYFDLDKEIFHLWCIHPGNLLQKTFEKAQSSILFSATIIPIDYYKNFLAANSSDLTLQLPSPFPLANLGLFAVTNINTTFRHRHLSYNKIVEYIRVVSKSKVGNYLVFFPSYAYLESVKNVFIEKYPEIKILEQERHMDDEKRLQFLQNFTPQNSQSLIGFAVLGGIFSEGIDLVGERISGVIIVGVGLPQICTERDLIRRHFDEKRENGFAYAYAFPGMNRVMQAAGRVIRTENDIGIILLIGSRFSQELYKKTVPSHWYPHYTYSEDQLSRLLQSFWLYPRKQLSET